MAEIQFGILTIPYQTLDVAGPIDLLFSCSQTILELMGDIPQSHIDAAIPIKFHHIGTDLITPVELTSNMFIIPTTTLSTCPKLDYLLIGGPFPSWIKNSMTAEQKSFVRERIGEVKTVFTTCTGALVLAETGVLDGVRATTNHEFLELAKRDWPGVEWVRENWVVEGWGKFMTAGGACVGMDMMASWLLGNFERGVVLAAFRGLGYAPRDVEGKMMVL